MPLYDYRCTQCGHVSEVRHGFSETHTAPCEQCGGALTRVFNPAPIVFKGSGFYATDSRTSSKSDSSSKSDGSSSDSSASSSSTSSSSTSSSTESKKSSDSAA